MPHRMVRADLDEDPEMIESIRTHSTGLARRLTMTLSALVLALAGMTAAAVPARANNDDLAKILLGATAVFIIGSAINNAGRADTRHDDRRRDHWDERRGPGRHAVPVLPRACAISISGHGTRYYGERCLRKSGIRAHLPQRCERTLRTNRGQRTVYDGQCMVNAGFRTEGDRRRDDRHSRR
jgi:hypothetical protein